MKFKFTLTKEDLYDYNYDIYTNIKEYANIFKDREKIRSAFAIVTYLIILVIFDFKDNGGFTLRTPIALALFSAFIIYAQRFFYKGKLFHMSIKKMVDRFAQTGAYNNVMCENEVEFLKTKVNRKANGEKFEIMYDKVEKVLVTSKFIYVMVSGKAIILPLDRIDTSKDEVLNFIKEKTNAEIIVAN